jgi:hypothetical protein
MIGSASSAEALSCVPDGMLGDVVAFVLDDGLGAREKR